MRRKAAMWAARRAAEVRRTYGIHKSQPADPYAVATRLGATVMFDRIQGVEGLFISSEPPLIVVAAERPAGRQAFSCGHEIGHYCLNHNSVIDNSDQDGLDITANMEEFLAEVFAGYLLMPRTAVRAGFASRSLDPETCSAVEFYTVARWLGVGYGTLVNHAHRSIGAIDTARARTLAQIPVRTIKKEIIGEPVRHDLILVDESWGSRSVDLRVGDIVTAREIDQSDSNVISEIERSKTRDLCVATEPGEATLSLNGEVVTVRVARRHYVGNIKNMYRREADHVF